MEELIEIKQQTGMYECTVRCSDKVKSFKVDFDGNRVCKLEVELKECKEE